MVSVNKAKRHHARPCVRQRQPYGLSPPCCVMDAYHILDPLSTGLFFFLLRLRLEPVSTTTIYCRLKRLVVLILSHAIIYGHVLMWSLRHFFHKIDTSLVSLFVVALLIPALVPTNIFVLNLMIWQLN